MHVLAGHRVGAALWEGSRPIYPPLVNDVVVLVLAVAVFQYFLFCRKKTKANEKAFLLSAFLLHCTQYKNFLDQGIFFFREKIKTHVT